MIFDLQNPLPNNHNNTNVQRQLEAPMPWIGMYVALASLACSLAIIADVIHGFRSKKLWFPCKYFSLNATFLTLLAVALKLPVDLTTNMWAVTDRLAKISSLSLMSTAIGNFMPSIGSMSDKDILINVTALGILVITVVVDVCIQIVETRSFLGHRLLFPEEVVVMSLMLVLFFVLLSSSVMVLTTKKHLEAKYQEKHSVALNQEFSDMQEVTTDRLVDLVKKYWVMAKTSCPQFVVARSVTCATCGVICLLNALILGEARIRTFVVHKKFSLTASSYGFSTDYILMAQLLGVLAGTIAPAFRWYTAISIRLSSRDSRQLRDEFEVEDYWTEKLKEMKGSSVASRCRYRKCRKVIHNVKGLILSCFVVLQTFIVLSSKLVLVISSSIVSPFFSLFEFFNKYLSIRQPVGSFPRVDGDNTGLRVRQHSLCLPGEAELSESTLKGIWKEVDKVIEKGESKKLENLLQLLQRKSHNLQGVANFDSSQVVSLRFRELPNCWSLPVVTLTSIAVALPNVAEDRVDQLIRSVSEGLFCVKLIENCLYKTPDLKSIAKAADIWVEVELSGKWQKMDLRKMSEESRNTRQTLQKLADEGKRIVVDFSLKKSCPLGNPNVIAANSMYRISESILLSWDEEQDLRDEDLFDLLSVMIADILAGCLSNLTHVITTKCHHSAIEEREKSVHQAALLLGQTGGILEYLFREGPIAEQVVFIDEWRSSMQQPNEVAMGEIPDGDDVVITVVEGDVMPEVLVPCHHQSWEDYQSASTVEMARV